MRQGPTLILALALVTSCDDDTVAGMRTIVDAGHSGPVSGPLLLKAGWRFTYAATLERAFGAQNASQSTYTLEMTIASVNDRGAEGDSTIDITATGMNTRNDRWDLTAGADSWVARHGPSDPGDAVSAAPRTIDLDDEPRAPPGPPDPKVLPSANNFFLDFRYIDQIRADFSKRHEAMGPSALAPDQHPAGRWRLSLTGDDADIVYYDNKRRVQELEYDPRGFLVLMRETIGDRGDPSTANGNFSITLVSSETPDQ